MRGAPTIETADYELRKQDHYRLGTARLSSAKEIVAEEAVSRFRFVFDLYDKKHSGAALLLADAAVEGFLYELLQGAVQEHFHLTARAAKLALLTKPGRPL